LEIVGDTIPQANNSTAWFQGEPFYPPGKISVAKQLVGRLARLFRKAGSNVAVGVDIDSEK
jgi:hypothetical protein